EYFRVQALGSPTVQETLRDLVRLGVEQVNPLVVTELDLQGAAFERDPHVIPSELPQAVVVSTSDLGDQVEQRDVHALHRQIGLVPIGGPSPPKEHVAPLVSQPAEELDDVTQFRP